MRVRAMQLGYYGLIRRNEGEVFEMSESLMKKDKASGKLTLPRWVERADGSPESIPKGTGKQELQRPSIPPAVPAGAPAAADGSGDVI